MISQQIKRSESGRTEMGTKIIAVVCMLPQVI